MTLHQIQNERAGGGKSNDSTEGGGGEATLYMVPSQPWENSKLTPAIFSVRERIQVTLGWGGGGVQEELK